MVSAYTSYLYDIGKIMLIIALVYTGYKELSGKAYPNKFTKNSYDLMSRYPDLKLIKPFLSYIR